MSHQSQAHPGPATNYSKAPGCHLSLRDPRYSHRKTARWDRLPFRSLSDSSRKGGFTTLAECLYHIYGPKHQRPLRTDCRLDCGQGLCCVPIFYLTQLESISVKLTPRAQAPQLPKGNHAGVVKSQWLPMASLVEGMQHQGDVFPFLS